MAEVQGRRGSGFLIGCLLVALFAVTVVVTLWYWLAASTERNIVVGWKGSQVYVFNRSLAPILITHLSTSTSGQVVAELPKPILMSSHSETEIPITGLKWEFSPYGQQEDAPKPNSPIFIVYKRMSVIGQ